MFYFGFESAQNGSPRDRILFVIVTLDERRSKRQVKERRGGVDLLLPEVKVVSTATIFLTAP